MAYCYTSNGAGTKCEFRYVERCTAQGIEITLHYGLNIHHVYISQNNAITDSSQYVNQSSMNSSYIYTANQTGSNPSTWATQGYIYVCGAPTTIDSWDGVDDVPDWAQSCYTGVGGSSVSSLNFNKVYIYYKASSEYNLDQANVQAQYEGIKEWLGNYSYTGLEYHTVIGGGGARWADWASSAYTGVINNAGSCSVGNQPIMRCADTAGWEEYNDPTANGGVGDTHIWSHNDATIDDFYCHVTAGTTTNSTNNGTSITSLGLPPAATKTDNALIIIFNDESACCYHGEQPLATININGTDHVNGVHWHSQCNTHTHSMTIEDGKDNTQWANDYNILTGILTNNTSSGGKTTTVVWPSQKAGSQQNPKHNSYSLHLSGCVHSTDGTGKFPANSKQYFYDWYNPSTPYSNAYFGDDITTCRPMWNSPPAINCPDIAIMEQSNPYMVTNGGGLDQYNVTYPFNFPGTGFSNSITIADPATGTYNPNLIPKFSVQLDETLLNQTASGWSTAGSPCTLSENCVTIQAIDLDGNPVSGFPIETDLNGATASLTNANGYAFYTGIDNGTQYEVFGESISFTGICMEYLVQINVGVCEFTPSISCTCACDDPAADNYDAAGDYYDSKECPCRYSKLGCTDPNACNYDASATADDNSCVYPGCTDPDATNYDATAGCDDGSCLNPQAPCDIAYGEYNPADNLTDVDVKRIETESRFADNVYKHFQARRFGMTSPCETTLDGIATEKYLCFWEDKKEKEYTSSSIEREVFKPLVPGELPLSGTYPAWVDPLCGLIEKGQLTVYFYYDGTSMGVDAVKTAHATTELWMQTLLGSGFSGTHYHTVVSGERWVDWATSAITGVFNNAGSNTSTTLPCSNTANPSCGPGRACGGCGVPVDPNDGMTGGCACSGWAGGTMNKTLKVQDNFQNGDCPTHFYDNFTKGSVCNTWLGTDGWTPKGPIVTWQGMAPPAATEQVLVVCFADETEIPGSQINNDINFACYHGRGSTTGSVSDWNLATISGVVSPAWKADYDKYIEVYNEFEGRSCNHSLNCYIYPSLPTNVYSSHRPFPLHAIGGVTSGNRPIQDGTFLTGTAPVNTMSNASIAAIELPGSNLYWNEPNTVTQHGFGYGGLDNYGWGGTFTSAAFTQAGFTSDLNGFFSLELYECVDNECLIFDVINQNGISIEDYEIVLDGKDVGKTNSFGRYTHIIPNASINTEHTAQLCECFTTSGDCAQQRLLITAVELCPATPCVVAIEQCDCSSPGNLQVSTTLSTSTYLNWSSPNSTQGTITYIVRYRASKPADVTQDAWIKILGITDTSYQLTGLNALTTYEFQISSICGTTTSSWNASQVFTTTSPCPISECLLSTCTTPTTYTLGYNYISIGGLSTSTTTGTWGIIWGTNADLEIGNIVNGGMTTNTMVPGSSSTYPGNGIPNTLITEIATGLTGNIYYWRAYMTPTNILNCTGHQYSYVCTFVTPPVLASQCTIPDNNFEQALMDLGLKAQGAYTGSIDTSAVNTVTSLDVNFKNISSLVGIECFVALEVLKCGNNNLTSLNLVSNTALTDLFCFSNSLTTLNLSSNTALTQLSFAYNNITTIDLSSNLALSILYAPGNGMTTLDVSANTALTTIDVSINQLTSLDLTANTSLIQIYCQSNPPMNFLDVTNGNNSNMPTGDFNCTNTPSLTCVSVDSIAYSNANWPAPLYTDTGDTYANPCVIPTLCTIPDSNFRNALDINQPQLAGQWVNTNQIDQALLTPITVVDLRNSNISDFSGLECFTGAQYILVGDNPATSIDITQNTALLEFSALNSLFPVVDFSQNILLTHIHMYGADQQTVDWSSNVALEHVNIRFNSSLIAAPLVTTNNINLEYLDFSILSSVTSIDISTNVQLESLMMAGAQMTSGLVDTSNNPALELWSATLCNLNSIDVSTNTALVDLQLENNNLTSLDLTSNSALENLRASVNSISNIIYPTVNNVQIFDLKNNDLTTFDATTFTNLKELELEANNIPCIDISPCVLLTKVNVRVQGVSLNTLLTLNLANGNNTNMLDANVRTTGNSNLTCITVDNVAYSSANWTTFVDPTQTFNLGCSPLDCTPIPMTYIPDNNFKSYLISTYGIVFPITDYCLTSDIDTISTLVMGGQNIADMTGVQDFIGLTQLWASGNPFTTIDVTPLTSLLNLNISNGSLASIDLTQNTSLIFCFLSNNNLTTLDVTQCPSLGQFLCSDNNLTSLDLTNSTGLYTFQCMDNSITSLDASNCSMLALFHAFNNSLTSLNIKNTNNSNMTIADFRVTNNNLTTITCDNPAAYTATHSAAANCIDAGVTYI